MKTVKVKKAELLSELRKNKKNHRNIFLEAQKRYAERYIQEIEKRLSDAREGKRFDQYIGLPVPEDHTADYQRAIKMMVMSVEETIELTESEFATYVMDDWAWKRAWAANTASYTQN